MRLLIIAIALIVMAYVEVKTFDLSRELNSLKVSEEKLQIEKLKYELSIYKEQEAASKE